MDSSSANTLARVLNDQNTLKRINWLERLIDYSNLVVKAVSILEKATIEDQQQEVWAPNFNQDQETGSIHLLFGTGMEE